MTTHNTRILIIDDDQDIWNAYQLVLEPGAGAAGTHLQALERLLHPGREDAAGEQVFQLSFARQGQEGCALAAEALAQGKPYALAFVDVRMPPGWDGMETAARLHQIDPDLEIIIVTAYSDRSCDEIVRAVGSPHKLLFLHKPFDPEELKRLAVSLTDKWHLARDEEARRRELQTLLCTSPAAIFSIDGEQSILSWNQASEFITGYSAAEVVGKKCIFRRLAEDPSCRGCTATCNLDLAVQDKQFAIRDKQGARKVLAMSVAHVPATKDRPAKSIGSFWDVTSLLTTQEKLAQVNRQLQQEIEEKDRLQLEQINLERKLHQAQKMEALGLMAGGVAHDLNNILSGLVGYPDLLLLQLPKDSPIRDSILAIRESGRRAAAVVSDLLTIARGASTARETVSLNTLITEYLDSPEGHNIRNRYPGVEVRLHLGQDGLNISCSPVHVKKCVMNLLTNAAEAISTTGAIDIATTRQVISEAEAQRLDVQPGSFVVLAVTDTGPGISPADQQRIFEPFYTKKSMGASGTGLGLTVVWNTVKDHRGAITLRSSEQGTTFSLYFPETEGAAAKKPLIKSVEDLAGSGTILIVDDEKQQCDITRRILEVLGYTVTVAASGEEAVAYLRDQAVDLVLLDMVMYPGMNGRQTYERIIELYPGQKALFVSGYSQDEEVEKAMRLGVDGFVRKPFTMEQLGLAVQEEMQAPPKK